MRIQSSDIADPYQLTPRRVTALVPPADDAPTAQVSISFSSLSRMLSDPTIQGYLPPGTDLQTLLTARDVAALSLACEYCDRAQLPAEQLHKLVSDLVRFRTLPASEAAAQATEPGAALPTLRSLPQEAETDARAVLSHLVRTDSALDPAFVRDLIRPDNAQRQVGLPFLHRVVVALSAQGTSHETPPALLERREARELLGQSLAELSRALGPFPELELAELSQGQKSAVQRLLLPARSAAEQAPSRALLSSDDVELVGVLYAAARARHVEPAHVDRVAHALLGLRRAESAPSPTLSYPGARQSLTHNLGPLRQASFSQPAARAPSGTPDGPAPGAEAPRTAAQAAQEAAARAYGSRSQWLAKSMSAYGSLAPPSMLPPRSLPPAPHLAALGSFAPGAPDLPSGESQPFSSAGALFSGRLDLAQALGLSHLVEQLRARRSGAQKARGTHRGLRRKSLSDARDHSPDAEALLRRGSRLRLLEAWRRRIRAQRATAQSVGP